MDKAELMEEIKKVNRKVGAMDMFCEIFKYISIIKNENVNVDILLKDLRHIKDNVLDSIEKGNE